MFMNCAYKIYNNNNACAYTYLYIYIYTYIIKCTCWTCLVSFLSVSLSLSRSLSLTLSFVHIHSIPLWIMIQYYVWTRTVCIHCQHSTVRRRPTNDYSSPLSSSRWNKRPFGVIITPILMRAQRRKGHFLFRFQSH